MAVCCLGPVCVPYTAIWPLVVFLVKWLWDRFGTALRRLLGFEVPKQEEVCCAAVEVPRVTSMADWQARIKKGTVFVDFTATWCKPCKKIAPFFGSLAAQYADVADFLVCDIDDLQDVATEANVLAVPTFQVYVDGLPAAQVQGADHAKLRNLVESHVKSKDT